MTEQELGIKFREVVKGRNIFTPQILEYRKIKGGIVEISKGSKFLDAGIPYGITVLKNNKHSSDLSKCCWSLEEVEDYIKILNND